MTTSHPPIQHRGAWSLQVEGGESTAAAVSSLPEVDATKMTVVDASCVAERTDANDASDANEEHGPMVAMRDHDQQLAADDNIMETNPGESSENPIMADGYSGGEVAHPTEESTDEAVLDDGNGRQQQPEQELPIASQEDSSDASPLVELSPENMERGANHHENEEETSAPAAQSNQQEERNDANEAAEGSSTIVEEADLPPRQQQGTMDDSEADKDVGQPEQQSQSSEEADLEPEPSVDELLIEYASTSEGESRAASPSPSSSPAQSDREAQEDQDPAATCGSSEANAVERDSGEVAAEEAEEDHPAEDRPAAGAEPIIAAEQNQPAVPSDADEVDSAPLSSEVITLTGYIDPGSAPPPVRMPGDFDCSLPPNPHDDNLSFHDDLAEAFGTDLPNPNEDERGGPVYFNIDASRIQLLQIAPEERERLENEERAAMDAEASNDDASPEIDNVEIPNGPLVNTEEVDEMESEATSHDNIGSQQVETVSDVKVEEESNAGAPDTEGEELLNAEAQQNGSSSDKKHVRGDETSSDFELVFANYVDLQSRLVLVPFNDGECLGAVIASFASCPTNNSSGDETAADEGDAMKEVDLDAENSEEKKGDELDENQKPASQESTFAPPIQQNDIVGSVLVKIPSLVGDNEEEDDDDWTQVDFTYILGAIREVKAPIVLQFRRADAMPSTPKSDNSSTVEGESTKALDGPASTEALDHDVGEKRGEQKEAEAEGSDSTSALLSNRLSRWGSKVRSSTSQLAQEAKERARVAMEEAERQLEKKGITDRIDRIAGVSNETNLDTTDDGVSDSYESSYFSDSETGVDRNDVESSREIEESIDADELSAEAQQDLTTESLTPSPRTWEDAGLSKPPCGLYLQKASGSFAQLDVDPTSVEAPRLPLVPSDTQTSLSSPVPLRPTVSSSSLVSRGSVLSAGSRARSIGESSGGPSSWRRKLARQHPVTNTSILIIRASVETPSPARGYEFQWYRSCRRADDDNSIYYDSDDDGTDVDGMSKIAGWYPLEGATYAAFQPSATDIGHRIRCVITVNPDDDGESTENVYTVACEMPYPVVADSGLFNAARQSFSGPNGGVFANLKGRGNADGRMFRLQIMPDEKGSRLRMYQTSGTTSEPIHNTDEPIMRASAIAAPSEPKVFELIFPFGLPPSCEMVQALCSDDGHFRLRAPNRISRESLLLSLGIANYCAIGKPVDLTVATTLFPDAPPGVDIEYERRHRHATDEEEDMRTREVQVVSPVREEDCEEALSSGVLSPEALSPTSSPLSPKTPGADAAGAAEADARFQSLENELRNKIEKLFAKEKTCADLQRKVASTESAKKRSDDKVKALRSESDKYKAKFRDCQKALRLAEKKIEMNDTAMARMKQEYEERIASLENSRRAKETDVSDRDKTIKSLQNERAVLTAAVEARDSKLQRLDELQVTVNQLKDEAAKGQSAKQELDVVTSRFNATRSELERAKVSESERCNEIERLKKELETAERKLKQEQKLAERCKAQMESSNMKYQKIKVERNTFRQKAESLAKDMSRVCKNGRGVNDIESVMDECETLKHEVSLLKTQKRKALDELEESRRLHEQSIKAQVKAGIDGEAVRALEQRDELDRVVTELTEYIDAKEMQLQTMLEVNRALQDEVHVLAQARMGEGEV